jgi:transcriptional regulator with XRE-family HTH domain
MAWAYFGKVASSNTLMLFSLMDTAQLLRSKRVAAEIPATLLAARGKVNRSRLSQIERGYIRPTEEEVQRLTAALDALIQAKFVVDRVAASVGWPLGARHD